MRRAIDTNVLARALADDGSKQVAVARSLVARTDVYVPLTVLLETEWVLRTSVGLDREMINRLFAALSGMDNVEIEHRDAAQASIILHAEGFDFADAIHMACARECATFLTFDRKLVRQAKKRGLRPPVALP
ncbi:MAG: hypothetical protein BroJett030_09040 [Alphaproteobacteria bacterium]|nr:MAG: hypothetical protein BroJett030_09040 [Alphaproteobacteria bacterium]